MAADEEVSVDAASVAVLSELDGILTMKNNIKKAIEGFFLGAQHSFLFFPSGFSKSSIRHSGTE